MNTKPVKDKFNKDMLKIIGVMHWSLRDDALREASKIWKNLEDAFETAHEEAYNKGFESGEEAYIDDWS